MQTLDWKEEIGRTQHPAPKSKWAIRLFASLREVGRGNGLSWAYPGIFQG